MECSSVSASPVRFSRAESWRAGAWRLHVRVWALYLSLCSVGSPFLNFQWDALLLETALLAVFWLPWRLRPRWNLETHGQQFARWLNLVAALRLMFESGGVKLTLGRQDVVGVARTGISL
jgi:hypothetical protein